MRYALVSDLHSNLQAWNAVLADLTALKVDKIICLGDVVGYGPQPRAVFESAYCHIDYFVLGNHDAVVAGKMPDSVFNDNARRLIRWTASKLSARAKSFIAGSPLVLNAKGFTCVHGSLDHPQAFNYIISPEEALSTWQATDEQLVFVGHSHVPGIFVIGASGTPHLLPAQDFMLEEGKRYIINAGSVGNPRDDDPRASYCIYDDTTRIITFRRVAFDYEALRSAVHEAGLDTANVPLLVNDPLAKRATVREMLDFSPPKHDKSMARNVVATSAVGTLRKANTLLRKIAATAAIAFFAAAGVATSLIVNGNKSPSASFPPEQLENRKMILPGDVNADLLPRFNRSVTGNNSIIEGWRYTLEDPVRQSVNLFFDPMTDNRYIVITNAAGLSVELEPPDWELNGFVNGRVQVMQTFIRPNGFEGHASYSVVADKGLSSETVLLQTPIKLNSLNRPIKTQSIMDKDKPLRITPDTKTISFRIKAKFSGPLFIGEPSMKIKPD